ncbi:hypothetical protein CGZ80_08310 [Rhodopirellula sp. MGV]|nr:hypothetical protein CGZ80_08310 [Rhodopirellula sp. MGV]PNY38452.1 hypothetical protein C2E31_00470 [Rhodopirellula baltica]
MDCWWVTGRGTEATKVAVRPRAVDVDLGEPTGCDPLNATLQKVIVRRIDTKPGDALTSPMR